LILFETNEELLLFDDAKIYVKNGSMQDIVLKFLLKCVKVLLMSEKFFLIFIIKVLFIMIKMVRTKKKLQKKAIFF
jgi:hypothetical protein